MLKRRVENKEYTTFRQFEADVRLMFSNCYAFNGPGTFVYNEGQELEAIFEKELENMRGKEHAEETQNMTIVESPATTPRAVHATLPASPIASTPSVVIKPPKPVKTKSFSMTHSSTPPASVSPSIITSSPRADTVMQERKKSITPSDKPRPQKTSEKEKMDHILTTIMANPHAFEFLRPVDPVKQGIPEYTRIIRHPMDLGKIKSRFDNDQYPDAQAMDRDMRLMFNNCYTFNPPNTYVHNESKMLEEFYEKEWKTYFGKRGSSDSSKKHKASVEGSVQQHTIKIKPLDRPIERSAERSIDRPAERPTERPVERLAERHVERPIERPVDRTVDRTVERTIDRPVDKYIDRSLDRSNIPSSPSSSKPPKAPKVHSHVSTNGSHKHVSTSPVVSSPSPAAPSPVHEKNKSKPTPPPMNPAMNEVNKLKCNRVLKKLWGLQESEPFRTPVDAVSLGIPQYYQVIKRPMDLAAIQKKYDNNQYNTVWELERDIRQIFWNCYGFNDHESWVAKQCQAMEKFFNQVWSAEFAISNALKGEDKRIASKVVNKLTLHDAAALFNEPVDIETLPDYTKVVRHPMDLRTIWEKLESSKYSSLKAVDHDIRTVFKNCFAYNLNNSYATDEGKKLEKYYNNIGKELRARINSSPAPVASSSKKRRLSSSPGPAKLSSSVSLSTEDQPPAKITKVSNHGIKSPIHVARSPSVTQTSTAAPKPPPLSVTKAPVVTVKPPSMTSTKPSANPSTKPSTTPSTKPSTNSSITHSKPPTPTSSSPSGSSTNKSPVHDTPQKLHPAMYAKLESFLTKMKSHRCAFGFTEAVSNIVIAYL